jgi:AraC-like DNA-binding protein
MTGTVLTVSSRAMLEACRRLGLDTSAILAAAALDPARVEDPDARIPVPQMAILWRKAYELSNDPDLAMHAIEVLPPGAYRVIDFLSHHAPSVGASLTKVSEYFPLINSVVRLPLKIGEREVAMKVEAPANPAVMTRPYAEYTMAAIFLRTRTITREPYRLARVEFSHPRPASTREHERIFGCPVLFGAPACCLVLTRATWEMPCVAIDPTLYDILDSHARILLGRLPDDQSLAGRVREAIGEELRGGDPRLATIARRLGMSGRTLQRRLGEFDIVFNDLVDQLRFAAARSYLAQRDIAATEVAYLLGFRAQSSFNRAFKRWSGQTPSEYRRAPRPA